MPSLFVWLVLLLFRSELAVSQDAAALRNGVVKISASVDGKQKTGTGFIVQLASDAVYIVTASHVVEGDNKPKVEFFTRQNTVFSAEVVKLEGGDPKGLALLAVRDGQLPRDTRALTLAPGQEGSVGEDVTAIGFPEGAGPWAVVRASVASRDGRDLTLSGDIDEGNSGGPILKDGKVVGLVTGLQGRFARATPAAIVKIALEGWGIILATGPERDPSRPLPPTVEAGAALPESPLKPPAPGFRLTDIDALRAEPASYKGPCPVQINFFWGMAVDGGAGRVTYQLVRSDNVTGPVEAITFDGPGSKQIRNFWKLGRADAAREYSGWVMLKVLEPQQRESQKLSFKVYCEPSAGAPAEETFIKVSRSSCQKIGSGNFKVELRGEAAGPEGALLFAAVGQDVTIMSEEMLCSHWTRVREKSDGCKREAAQPGKTSWSALHLVHSLTRLPSRVTVQLIDPGRQDSDKRLAQEIQRINCR